MLIAFPEPAVAVVIDIGEHLAHDPGRDIYQRLYDAAGIEAPDAGRDKPPCCDEVGPPAGTAEVDRLRDAFKGFTAVTRSAAACGPAPTNLFAWAELSLRSTRTCQRICQRTPRNVAVRDITPGGLSARKAGHTGFSGTGGYPATPLLANLKTFLEVSDSW